MVDYNKQVKEAIALIDKFAEKGKFTTEDICFHITRELGFGDKFTKRYLNTCFERNFFTKDENGIIKTK